MQGVVVQDHAADAAVLGQHARLGLDLLGGEESAHGRQERVPVQHVDVAGQLLDAVDPAHALDLDGDGAAGLAPFS